MKMEKPMVEAVRFNNADVIATSGERGVWLGGFGNREYNDWFVSNKKGAQSGSRNEATILGYLNDAAPGEDFTNINSVYFENESNRDVFSRIDDYSSSDESYNGWYTWYSSGWFKKKS